MGRKTLTYYKKLLRQARIFLSLGFWLIPIPPRRKAPRLKGWPELRLSVRDLKRLLQHDGNLGVLLGEPSHGLTDVDIDCLEAIKVAAIFLPKTDRVHGRRSKPGSHAWYVVLDVLKPKKFADLDGTALVEVRSTGQFTLIPPSIHPSSERMFWKRTGEPRQIRATQLMKAVTVLAACTLVARHWPRQGSRHDFTLALSGFLLRHGWTSDDVEKFVTAAAAGSGIDEEWKLRKADVRTTVKRLEEGRSATGAPRLAAIVGDAVVARLSEWLQIPAESSIVRHDSGIVCWPEPIMQRAFHGLAGEIVGLIGPHTESDTVAILGQILAFFGNLIGRGPYFTVEADKHNANIFVVLVGATSKARKGSSLSHVKSLFELVDPNWAQHCVASGLSSGEGLLWAVRDQIRSHDGTKVIDEGVSDKRLLVIETEFAQQLRHMARPNNILSTTIRQGWDKGDLQTLTKNSPCRSTNAHISIIAHATTHDLRRYLSSTDIGNGFANRFLWLCVKRANILPEGGNLRARDLRILVQRLAAAAKSARKIHQVTRDDQARKLWSDVYPELSEGKPGLLGSVISRAEAQVTRLALIYALLDSSSIIRAEHLQASLALWSYAESSAQFIFGQSLGDPLADKILEALRSASTGLTRTEISNHLGRHCSSSSIANALTALAQNGLASVRQEVTGGRPDERWFSLRGDAKNAKKED